MRRVSRYTPTHTLAFLCVLSLMSYGAAGQTGPVGPTRPTASDDGEPYGGVSIRHASAATPGALPAVNAGGVCNPGDPCVLTGQYSRYRTSANPYEQTLAAGVEASSFGLTNFYQFPAHTLPLLPDSDSRYTFEPAVAQPLYLTNLPINGTTKNVLLVASLDDYVYAFDTSDGTILWSANLANDCGVGTGLPFDNTFKHSPGGTNLVYYGVVATPVIDIYSNVTQVPVAFVVSACVLSAGSSKIQWNLDAINIETGQVMNSPNAITATGFNPSFQLARASLLLTHPTTTTTSVYVAFGTGAGEVVAATPGGCPAGFTSCNYSGWMFLYSVTYNSSSSVTFSQTASFATSGTGRPTSTVYPPVYANFDTLGPPEGPSGVGPLQGGAYDRGDNWAVSQGGIWQSSGGPSSGSTAANDVYAAAGNGPFGCTNPDSSQCPNPANVVYWGSSVMKFPSATSATPLTPLDFYAPNQQTYTTNSNGDPDASKYETGELSRLDLDFGSTPPVIVPLQSGQAPMFALVGDKSGYMYVMPAEPNGTTATVTMGEFQKNDKGLTNGAVNTQLPYQVSQLPVYPNTDPMVCPIASDGSPWTNGNGTCDEIHEIALLALADNPIQLAFVWPVNESVEVFAGNVGVTSTGYNYTLSTEPQFNPCPIFGYTLPEDCQGSNPLYPGSLQGGAGGAMAIASAGTEATLWAITPDPNVGGTWGWLYAYTIDIPDEFLIHDWDSGTGMGNCGNASANGWVATAFTEPTLANGAAYVPTVCVVTGTSMGYQNCLQVPPANIASGILVFSACQ